MLPFAGLWSCASDVPAPAPAHCPGVELIVAASDYQSSVACGAPGCVAGYGTTGEDLGGDPQLAATSGRAFFLARDNDLVFELDPSCGTASKELGYFSVHDLAPTSPVSGKARNANPHDVAAAPDGTLFVPLYNSGVLAFVKNGKLDGPPLSLASYDPDGNPQPDALRIVDVGGKAKAFVTLERLDDHDELTSKQSSQMLRVDVATRSVEAVVELAGRNPLNWMAEWGGGLFLAEPGNVHSADDTLAGIERFDTASSTSRIVVPESGLGGSVVEVAVAAGCGVAIVAGPIKDVNPTWIMTFDPDTGRVISGAPSAPTKVPLLGPTPGFDLAGLAWRGHTLYIGDRRRLGSGYPVHVYEDAGACNLTDAGRTIDLPQRPVALRPAK
jgi:hypothetical protein